MLKFNTILAYLICQKRFSRKSILKKHTTEVHLKENPLEFNVWQPKKSNDHFSATAHNEREDYTAKSIEYPTLKVNRIPYTGTVFTTKKPVCFPVYFFRKTIGNRSMCLHRA